MMALANPLTLAKFRYSLWRVLRTVSPETIPLKPWALGALGAILGSIIIPGFGSPSALANPLDETSQGIIALPHTPDRVSEEARLHGSLELLMAILQETSTLTEETDRVRVWQAIATQIKPLATSYSLDSIDDRHPLTDLSQQLEQAIADIDSPRRKADMRVTLASVRAAMGHEGEAIDDLAIATQTASAINTPGSKAKVLIAIATAYIKLDRRTQATEVLQPTLALAAQVNDVWAKPQILHDIAAAHIALGNHAKAADILDLTVNAINVMEPSPAKSIRWEEVVKLSQQFRTDALTIRILDAVLRSQQDFGQTNASDAFVTIATAAGELQNSNRAAELLVSIVTMVSVTDNPFTQLRLLEAIAPAVGKLSNPEDAAVVLTMATQAVEHIDDVWNQAKALVAIATAYEQLGDSQQAADHLSEALTTINIPYGQLIAEALAEGEEFDEFFDADAVRNLYIGNQLETLTIIATTAVDLQDTLQAAALLETVVEVGTRSLVDFQYGVELIVWTEVAKHYGQIGHGQRANRLLDQAVSIAQQLLARELETASGVDSEGPFIAMQLIAEAYIDVGHPQQAAVLLREAIAQTEQLSNERERFAALRGLVKLHGDLGDVALAQQGLALATTQNSFSAAYPNNAILVFRDISKTYGQLDDLQGMDTSLQQSLAISQASASAQNRQLARDTLAVALIYRQFDQNRDATRLLDMAHRITQNNLMALPFTELKFADILQLQTLAKEYDALGHSQKAMEIMTGAIAIIDSIPEDVDSQSWQTQSSSWERKSTQLEDWIVVASGLSDDATRFESLTAMLPIAVSLEKEWERARILISMVEAAVVSDDSAMRDTI
ncbi:MAG: hypothetical protein AAGD25_19050 [Cyanobacteria bacterium P01_F01_bin.150]